MSDANTGTPGETIQVSVSEITRLRAEVRRLQALVNDLSRLAYTDPLLDLPNRRAFLAGLQSLMARGRRYGDTGAVLFLDVDGLKSINDGLGHRAGDAALHEIARILKETARESDCIARIGGDEFAILLERSDELNAWNMGLRVVEAVVGAEFSIKDQPVRLSVAVGVGCVDPLSDPETVLELADRSMYQIKGSNAVTHLR